MSVLEKMLLGAFSLFIFTSAILEPITLATCGWDQVDACVESGAIAGKLWEFYASISPVFLELPYWLKMLNSSDTIVFLPLYYAPTVYALLRNEVDSKWFRVLGSVMSGALLYAVLLNLGWLALAGPVGTNLAWVFCFNVLYFIVPLLLLWRIWNGMTNEGASDRDQRLLERSPRTPSAV